MNRNRQAWVRIPCLLMVHPSLITNIRDAIALSGPNLAAGMEAESSQSSRWRTSQFFHSLALNEDKGCMENQCLDIKYGRLGARRNG